jgi:integrase
MANTTSRRRIAGEGSIYPEGNGFRAAITLPDGTVVRRRGKTRPEVLAKLDAVRAEVKKGFRSTDTLGPFLEWWLDVAEAKVGTGDGDKSLNTLINYRWALGPVIDQLGGIKVLELQPEHVERLLARLARAGMARNSVKRVRAVLGQALDTAMRRGKATRNVARLAEMPATKAPAEKRSLTVEQAAALLQAAAGDETEAFIVVGLTLGLRPGELLGVRWADIDLDGRTLEVTGSLKREGSTLRLGDVKRGIRQSRRRLNLPDPAVDALRAHRAAQRERRMLAGPEWVDHGLVFTSPFGGPIDPSGMNRKLAKVTERAGIGRWSMTELARHSAASLLSAAGVPLEDIADTLGHSSTRMLEKHYRHQLRPSLDAHVAVMNDLFG